MVQSQPFFGGMFWLLFGFFFHSCSLVLSIICFFWEVFVFVLVCGFFIGTGCWFCEFLLVLAFFGTHLLAFCQGKYGHQSSGLGRVRWWPEKRLMFIAQRLKDRAIEEARNR